MFLDLTSRNKEATISIVTPCLNHSKYLEEAMGSVLDQDYPRLEYVVMDGGSTDGTLEILERYRDRLAHWESGPDGGQYDAINQGFSHTSGEIMGWLNADDMLHRNALWTVAEIFQRFPQVEWLMGNPTNYDHKGRIVFCGKAPRWSRYRYLMGDFGWIQQESVFWRRTLWERAGGKIDTRFKYAADLQLWMRFFRHADLYTTEALIGGFRVSSDNQLSRKFWAEYLAEANRIIAEEPHTIEDETVLQRIIRHRRVLLKLPLIKRIFRRSYERLFNYMPLIVYDREKGTFVLSND